jgi:hypothetical protein
MVKINRRQNEKGKREGGKEKQLHQRPSSPASFSTSRTSLGHNSECNQQKYTSSSPTGVDNA